MVTLSLLQDFFNHKYMFMFFSPILLGLLRIVQNTSLFNRTAEIKAVLTSAQKDFKTVTEETKAGQCILSGLYNIDSPWP